MTDPLPWLFAVGACAALGGALVALWASFRAAFGGAVPIELSSEVDHDARVRLLEEKESLLKNLADLRFDHDAGKISDADFERLDGKLRERTKTVLRLLDADVEPFRAEAERLIAGRLGGAPRDPFREVAPEKRESGKSSEESTTKKEKKAVREAMLARSSEESTTKKEKKDVREAVLAAQDELAAAANLDAPTAEPKTDTKVCPSCATSNDVDAVFCKKCGHRFESASESSVSSASESSASESSASESSASESKGAEDER